MTKMILIADSGSTKTEWAVLNNEQAFREILTAGISPYVHPEKHIREIIAEQLAPELEDLQIDTVYYYGTGCSTDENKKLIARCIGDYIKADTILVEHDLLAAARAACGKEEGIAMILGTGSNSCYYNGHTITDNVVSLGFMLGDEGSGYAIGRALIRDYFYGDLPPDLQALFNQQYPDLNLEILLDHIYRKPGANSYLGSFTRFVELYKDHPYCTELVSNSMHEFFQRVISKYKAPEGTPIHCIGSIGIIFRDTLEEVARHYHTTIGRTIKSPMQGLITYHTS